MSDDQDKKNHPIQKIYFGSPGTGKSHKVKGETKDGITINAVFHPEYTYGDFMGKLLPHTQDGKVSYNYYPGHFMQALAAAYKEIFKHTDNTPEQVYLVIDEINRGNSAAIFGTVFQLLDRDNDGWSSYAIDISDMEKYAIFEAMGYLRSVTNGVCDYKRDASSSNFDGKIKTSENGQYKTIIANGKILLPPNLNIIGTMNTSDESIYYMDSAFKRRWGWEYIPVDNGKDDPELNKAVIEMKVKENGNDVEKSIQWVGFVNNLNEFLCNQHNHIRKVEDKQIGYYFIKAEDGKIPVDQIKNKLMFFLWDSVFARSKKPLEDLPEFTDKKLITFGDFCDQYETFITKIASGNTSTDTPT